MAIERRTIVFTGHVQGVGFRMTAVEFAEDFAVAGTVCNTADRGVELVLEGESSQIDALVTRLREHFGSFVRNVQYSISAPSGRLGRGVRVTY